ncbi:DUF2268 domain-containing putative Zn-dependent protease [Lutibacter flavus]|uniref:Uncharacterized protein YjaZ n=1 Tax=Lutibacter flavus TaxID=691689 RepID=A0A238VFT5_9FLAO|nr:DUF2268 domain-containing putative Zn-dependent protease [Lutibacter flavus]SNR32379.1 Uncharacterized protein YjaZ [Lutibacter flavus]
MIRIGFLLFALFLFNGCQQTVVPDFERTNFDIKGQKFEILTTKNLFENYLIEQQQFSDYNRASKKLLFNPIENEILENAEAAFMINSIKIPYEPSDFLKEQLKKFNTKVAIEIIEKELNSITDLIKGPDTKIILLPISPALKKRLNKYKLPGYGVALGSGKIIIAIDQTADNWKEYLSFTIAYEYHHSAWMYRNWIDANFSLLEYLIFEGKADAFAKSINNAIEVHSTTYISEEKEHFVWNLIEPDLDKRGSEIILKVMYGNKEIPFGSGYAIGYSILKKFKENNPTFTDLDIIDMEARTMLELSSY